MTNIYKITNKVTGEAYIGQTHRNILKRFSDHTRNAKKPLVKAMIEYGIDNFEVICLEECDDNDADLRERYWITDQDTLYPNGYNRSKGGISNFNLTLEDCSYLGDDLIHLIRYWKDCGINNKLLAEYFKQTTSVIGPIVSGITHMNIAAPSQELSDPPIELLIRAKTRDHVNSIETILNIEEWYKTNTTTVIAEYLKIPLYIINRLVSDKIWEGLPKPSGYIVPKIPAETATEITKKLDNRHFTKGEILDIRAWLAEGISASSIAIYFNKAQSTIDHIKQRKSYKDIKDDTTHKAPKFKGRISKTQIATKVKRPHLSEEEIINIKAWLVLGVPSSRISNHLKRGEDCIRNIKSRRNHDEVKVPDNYIPPEIKYRRRPVKLTAEDVLTIRHWKKQGASGNQLAFHFKKNRDSIRDIVNYSTHKNVTASPGWTPPNWVDPDYIPDYQI